MKPRFELSGARQLLLLLTVLLIASPAFSADRGDIDTIRDTVKKVFAAEKGGTLEVDADQGNVEVRSGRGDEVRVVVERIVDVDTKDEAKSILEAHTLVIEGKGNAIWVHSRVDRERFRWRSGNRIRIQIVVEVPEAYDLEIASGAGNIDVTDIRGLATLRTGAGNINTGHTVGTLDVLSGSGNITVRSADGSLTIRNGSGNLVLHEIQGQVVAETGAGNVTARIVSELVGDSRLATSAGNINVQIAESTGANVSAVSRVGSCTTEFPLKISGGWMKKSFDGSVNGGGPQLSLRSNVGNVSLGRLN